MSTQLVVLIHRLALLRYRTLKIDEPFRPFQRVWWRQPDDSYVLVTFVEAHPVVCTVSLGEGRRELVHRDRLSAYDPGLNHLVVWDRRSPHPERRWGKIIRPAGPTGCYWVKFRGEPLVELVIREFLHVWEPRSTEYPWFVRVMQLPQLLMPNFDAADRVPPDVAQAALRFA